MKHCIDHVRSCQSDTGQSLCMVRACMQSNVKSQPRIEVEPKDSHFFAKRGKFVADAMFLLFFSLFSLLLGANFSASPSNQRHHSNDRLSIKFQFLL